ncbi:tetratricopeptide repeat protein 28 isoform X2 [Syngnathus typhle]|uniref:tetratricopeptide repeat protein 28 isoform X2 n=1 Tax=Syngnathus typhle TaxID=161592 RepID=UPI002A6A7938|nr:tetratricopeptide repeat protein 28 isoform X2 [Syngnathus typhle]
MQKGAGPAHDSGPGKGHATSGGIRGCERACQQGDYALAARLCTEALAADPLNCVLYSMRSAAHLSLGRYRQALHDGNKARDINPKWTQAYFRQAVALQHLGRHGDALAAFASGLARDPKSPQLLTAMMEAAMKSPLRDSLEPAYRQLQSLKLERSPFMVVSLVGQELLTHGLHAAAAEALEAALQIGTCSLKMRGSVFSALGAAYWSLGRAEKSLAYMRRDLDVARTLGEQAGECRARGNLGAALFSKGRYREALANHRQQLILAMKLKHKEAAFQALRGLGHAYTAMGDYPNALASHKQCVALAKQNGCRLSEARQLGDTGAVYTAMGDVAGALRCHQEHLDIAKSLGNRREEARAYSNLGSAYHAQRDYDKAVTYHSRVLKLARELGDGDGGGRVEMRALAGLGHAARCVQDLDGALRYHRRQLEIAEELGDPGARGRASSNLGIVHQMRGDYHLALKSHKADLLCAQEVGDYAAQGRAYGNMGNAYHALGLYEQAAGFHRQELNISLEVNDRASQASTHGNLAAAYQALGAPDRALQHYLRHLSVSRELGDVQSQARALANLGNFHCCRGHYEEALPYYRQYLLLAPGLGDPEAQGKVCHNLAYGHFCLGHYQDAVRYYQQDLALAMELQDKLAQAKAYCNLGLAHKALGEFSRAQECHNHLLQIAKALDNTKAIFRALGNLGDVSICQDDLQGAAGFYRQQLSLAHQFSDQKMEADAYSALGSVHRLLGQPDTSLSFHSRELTLRKDLGDPGGECRALARLAAVHADLGDGDTSLQCYEAQLGLARQRLRDTRQEAQVLGNMANAEMNAGRFEEAVGFLEQQLAALRRSGSGDAVQHRGQAYGNMAKCYVALGDFDEAVRCYHEALTVARSLERVQDQAEAYRGLADAHRSAGNLQQALVCLEKRLVAAHQLGGPVGGEARAYGDLGALHGQMGNYEPALSCLERGLAIARSAGDKSLEAEASDELGRLYQLMGDYETALQWHRRSLDMAERAGCVRVQTRASANLGVTYEALGDYQQALLLQEQHLSMAAQTSDLLSKSRAYGGLGRIHHALGNATQAVAYLREGLRLAERSAGREDEAEMRHRLGLSLWAAGNLAEARRQLHRASLLFESVGRETQHGADRKRALLELQTDSYQALQRVLVSLGHVEEALAVAERARRRTFAHLPVGSDRRASVTVERILETVDSQKATVLYFSLARGFLHSWLLAPGSGVVEFNQARLGADDAPEFRDGSSLREGGRRSLEQYVCAAREVLGVDGNLSRMNVGSETESRAGEAAERRFDDELDGYLSVASADNVSNSAGVSPAEDGSSSPRRRRLGVDASPLAALYDLLIAPMEAALLRAGGPAGPRRQLVLVLDGDLYLVPFALLKGSSSAEFLYQMFTLLCVPSLASLRASGPPAPPCRLAGSGLVLVGAPGPWRGHSWAPPPSARDEALCLGERLGCVQLAHATKERALAALAQAQCVHFATHVSWKPAALVLDPGGEEEEGGRCVTAASPEGTKACVGEDACESRPPLRDFLLTAEEILELNLSVKLVVLRSYPESGVRLTCDGLSGLTGAFLWAGVRCVCVSLWATPPPAAKLFMQSFYSALLEGAAASAALAGAMSTLRDSKDFADPFNWAGYLLMGGDVRLNGPESALRRALAEVLCHADRARDTLRVLLHLVEKSLQRIHSGHTKLLYTSQQSVDDKVGGVPGWRPLLTAVGFRLDAGGSGRPAAVFFPTSDPGERLQRCSLTMQALLGLSAAAFEALCKLVSAPQAGEPLVRELHQVLLPLQLQSRDGQSDQSPADVLVSLSVRAWRLPGCHEFLAALGFDLCQVGREDVVLKTGKRASRRVMALALRSLLALFDSADLPERVGTYGSSSLESLSPSPPTPQPTSYPASPPRPSLCPDAPSADAISVYSLGSLASSLGFWPRPEPAGSDVVSRCSQAQEGAATPRRSGRLANLGKGEAGDEDHRGYAIISSEPLRPEDRCATVKEPRRTQEVSSPQRSKAKMSGREEAGGGIPAGQLDPEELTRKILEETRVHMRAVEILQRTPGRRSLSTPVTPILSRGARAFQPSETSAFSRPPSRTSLASASLGPLSPRPPCRSSSLQKLAPPSSPKHLAGRASSLHLKAPAARDCHDKPSPDTESRVKPSTGSKCHPKAVSSESHPKFSLAPPPSSTTTATATVPRFKSFKAARQDEGASPARLLPAKKMSTVKKDILGLLDLSSRHKSSETSDRLPSVDSKAPSASKASKRTKFPSGYKFLAGHFFPSSKC